VCDNGPGSSRGAISTGTKRIVVHHCLRKTRIDRRNFLGLRMEVELPLSLLNDFALDGVAGTKGMVTTFGMFPLRYLSRKPGTINLVTADVTFLTRPMPHAVIPVAELRRARLRRKKQLFCWPVWHSMREGQLIEPSIDPRPHSPAGGSAAALRSDHHPASPQRCILRQDILRSLATSLLEVFIAEEAAANPLFTAHHHSNSRPKRLALKCQLLGHLGPLS